MFFIFVITFEPNKIQTHLAPQNDRLNLSFAKYSHKIAKKWQDMVLKRLFIILFHFRTVYTSSGNSALCCKLQILFNRLFIQHKILLKSSCIKESEFKRKLEIFWTDHILCQEVHVTF